MASAQEMDPEMDPEMHTFGKYQLTVLLMVKPHMEQPLESWSCQETEDIQTLCIFKGGLSSRVEQWKHSGSIKVASAKSRLGYRMRQWRSLGSNRSSPRKCHDSSSHFLFLALQVWPTSRTLIIEHNWIAVRYLSKSFL